MSIQIDCEHTVCYVWTMAQTLRQWAAKCDRLQKEAFEEAKPYPDMKQDRIDFHNYMEDCKADMLGEAKNYEDLYSAWKEQE